MISAIRCPKCRSSLCTDAGERVYVADGETLAEEVYTQPWHCLKCDNDFTVEIVTRIVEFTADDGCNVYMATEE